MRDPIDETLDLPDHEELRAIFGEDVEIPKDPTLKTIVTLALEQYKALILASNFMQPEDRLSTIAQAERFLDLAKDAMYKESDLEIKFEKVKNPKGVQANKEKAIGVNTRKELCRSK